MRERERERGVWGGRGKGRQPWSECETHTQCTYHSDVSKLVSPSHSIVVQQSGAGDPPGVGVVSKYNQLVLLTAISHKVEAVLNVAHHHAVPHSVNGCDEVGNVLKQPQTCVKQCLPILLFPLGPGPVWVHNSAWQLFRYSAKQHRQWRSCKSAATRLRPDWR